MNINLSRLKEERPDWHEKIIAAEHEDIIAYYDLSFAAMSNNERASKALSAAFPGCEAIADWYLIESACSELMSSREVESRANKAKRQLDVLCNSGAGAVEAGARMVERETSKIRTMRIENRLTQQAMSDLLHIPKRTIENWEAGVNEPPEYVVELIAYRLKDYKPLP